jgi:hypothetical protein
LVPVVSIINWIGETKTTQFDGKGKELPESLGRMGGIIENSREKFIIQCHLNGCKSVLNFRGEDSWKKSPLHLIGLGHGCEGCLGIAAGNFGKCPNTSHPSGNLRFQPCHTRLFITNEATKKAVSSFVNKIVVLEDVLNRSECCRGASNADTRTTSSVLLDAELALSFYSSVAPGEVVDCC